MKKSFKLDLNETFTVESISAARRVLVTIFKRATRREPEELIARESRGIISVKRHCGSHVRSPTDYGLRVGVGSR